MVYVEFYEDSGLYVDIRAYPQEEHDIHYLGKLKAVRETLSNSLFIIDIQVKQLNQGVGSALMSYFLEYVKKEKFSKVEGNISSVDWGHVDRLKKYYMKFGFDVVLDPENKTGKVLKVL